MSNDILKRSLKSVHEGLLAREFSARELTDASLKRIEERNEVINAFITISEDVAREAAGRADQMIARGEATMLTGIPFGVKDAICTVSVRSTASATILDTYVPPYDATVVRKIREAGAVLVGKQNCDAFGHGASNEHSMYGPVRNPHDTSKVAGGSSGGSAASIADGQCFFSIGEDTGGSIRQPASLCGVAGLRPSYGRNSRYGIMPMASSLDVVGPLARTTEDIAYLMEVMAGKDERDATTVGNPVPKYSEFLGNSIKGMRIGVPKEYMELEGMDPEVRRITEENIAILRDNGCEIVDVSLPHTKYAIPVYYIVVPSEDSSNLGRIDGIRYGTQAEADSLSGVYSMSRAAGFPEEVKRRIMIGTYALSSGYYDAYYRKAQNVRTRIIEEFETVFGVVDALITPTSPFPAFGIGEKKGDVLAMYLADVFVSPASVAGLPALSIHGGMTTAGLPVGVQCIGPRLADAQVIQIGDALEKSRA